jgi:hypothetical protein
MAQTKPARLGGRDYEPLHTEAPVLTPEESRQGVVSGRVLTILKVSLLLAAIAAAILYTVWWG